MKKILIVGGGNMGKTYAESFSSNHTVSKKDLFILEHLEEKIPYFKALGFDSVFVKPGAFVAEMDLIIMAVKPQDFATVAASLATFVRPSQVILTIMAGVKMNTIKAHFPTDKIIRAMPNLPAQIGMGMTGFTSLESVSREELFMVHNLLSTTGKALYFDEESKLDAVTAISGSGPAYVYYFMNSMIEAAQQMGFSDTQSEVLVKQTFLGAIHLLNNNSISCKEWIERVASKGGTTEAALKEFNQYEVENGIQMGLENALRRAKELGQ